MKRASLLLAVGVAFFATRPALAQILNPNNGHYYQFVQAYISWTAAKAAASGMQYQGLQGYLATITCQQENDWIFTNLLVPLGGTSQTGIWIGGDQSPNGVEPDRGWRWEVCTGEPFNYTNWEPRSPDNASACEEFIEIHLGNGKWGDAGNGPVPGGLIETMGYIVEFGGPVSLPCPTTSCVEPCNPSCDGPQQTQCSNGIDDDGDGFTDYPNDAGCTSPGDDTEAGSGCVLSDCNDGIDNDGDGCTDFPCDGGCTSADDGMEAAGACKVPAVPSACSATTLGGGVVDVSWSDVRCESGYQIYRDGSLIAALPANSTDYMDSQVVGDHLYGIKAQNFVGLSAACEDSALSTNGWPVNGKRLMGPVDFYREGGPPYTPPEVVPDLTGGALVFWPTCGPGAKRVDASGQIPPPWPTSGTPADFGICGPLVAAAPDGSGGAFVASEYSGYSFYPTANHLTIDGALAPGWPVHGALLMHTSSSPARPCIVPDGSGSAMIFIATGYGYGIQLQRLNESGGIPPLPWPQEGVQVCGNCPGFEGVQVMMAACGDGAGGAYFAWVSGTWLYLQRFTSAGAVASGWPVGGLLVAQDCDGAPSMVADGAGGVVIAINHYGFQVWTFRALTTGSVDPAWPAGGTQVGWGYRPIIVGDGAGGTLTAWVSFESDDNIRAQHLGSNGAVVAGWPAPGFAVCAAPGEQYNLCVTDDGLGGFFAAWEDYRNSSFADIYSQHVRGDGTLAPGWPVNGRITCGARGLQVRPGIARVAAGQAIVSWYDFRDGATTQFWYYSQIYAQSGAVEGFLDPQADPTAVGDRPPVRFSLSVRPNPSRGAATVELTLPESRQVSIRVMDVAGRTVRMLEPGSTLPAGQVRRTWDGRDDAGRMVPAGLYWVRAVAGQDRGVRSLVLAR